MNLSDYIRVVFGFGPLFFGSSIALHSAEPASSATERFKDFLAHPPPISEVLFRLTHYSPKRTNTTFWYGRWQSNAMVLRQGRTASEAQEIGPHIGCTAFGYNSTNFWYVPASGKELYFQAATTNLTLSLLKNGTPLANAEGAILAYVMTFGLSGLRPGDVHWEGDSFSADCTYSGNKVHGQLRVKDGKAIGLDFKISTGREIYQWTANYKYSNDIGAGYLPAEIEIWWNQGNHPLHMTDIHILRLESTDVLAEEGLFHYSAYIATNRCPVISLDKVRHLTKSSSSTRMPSGSASLPVTYLFLSICTLFTLMAFSLLPAWKRGRIQTNSKTKGVK